MHLCEPFLVVHPTHISMHRAHRLKSAGLASREEVHRSNADHSTIANTTWLRMLLSVVQ